MRIYFLVEGRRTEAKVYEAWLLHLVPTLGRVTFPDEGTTDSYFLISAEGYPSVIYDMLPASVEDINRIGGYDYLVVCLDADESSVQERVDEINQLMTAQHLHARGASLVIIVQNRCIETWFLGNRRMVRRNPISAKLASFLRYYDVRLNDPELMGVHPDYHMHSQFHFEYLREIFRERGLTYSKRNPGHALEAPFLDELVSRITDHPNHLNSLQGFLRFCQEINIKIK